MDDSDFWIEPKVGPFFDADGEEIIPVGYEEVMEPFDLILGDYTILSDPHVLRYEHDRLLIGFAELTRFIQEDWDRVMAGGSPRRFLLATHSARYAAGRLAEEIILTNLLRGMDTVWGKPVETVYFWEAVDRGMVRRVRGEGSDDLVPCLDGEQMGLVESKASFSKSSAYLRRSRRKIERQLRATLEANPELTFVLAALINMIERSVMLVGADRSTFLNVGLEWLDVQGPAVRNAD